MLVYLRPEEVGILIRLPRRVVSLVTALTVNNMALRLVSYV